MTHNGTHAVRILVVDDHEVAREGIKLILSDTPFKVTGAAGSGDEAIERLEQQDFDLVLLDVRMDASDGLVTLERIRQSWTLPVMMISAYDNPTYIAHAAALGATDYVIKNGLATGLLEALERARQGQQPSSQSRLSLIQKAMRHQVSLDSLPAELPLTVREAQVLRHIALGLSNKEIARSLSISVETVKEHVQNILRKISANDRTEAAVRAVKLGLIE